MVGATKTADLLSVGDAHKALFWPDSGLKEQIFLFLVLISVFSVDGPYFFYPAVGSCGCRNDSPIFLEHSLKVLPLKPG